MKASPYYIFCFGIIALFLAACNPNPDTTIRDEGMLNLVKGNYSGTVPCADCSGIELDIQLNEDYTYYLSALYQGKSDTANTHTGEFSFLADSIVVLEGMENGMNYYAIKGDQLQMLDMDRNEIGGRLSDRYFLDKREVSILTGNQDNRGAEFFGTKWEAGTDLFAIGNEPSWTLDMDFDNKFAFAGMAGDTVFASAVAWSDNVNVNEGLIFISPPLEIKFTRDSCTDSMSGEKAPFNVKVKVDGKGEFEGCGYAITDPGLNGKWVVSGLTGTVMSEDDFSKGLPELQFSLTENRISGHDGCNQFSGTFYAYGDKLNVGQLAGTKMACPNMDKSQTFLDFFASQFLTMTLEDKTLVLRNIDDEIMELVTAN